ncbi:MAG: deoxyribodipyrimidine photolyase [Myxococcota bacterium]|nr:deoxyribodipyrimidine photolyase [Myxococcota bacterium]
MLHRVTPANRVPVRSGDYVLYWMIAARRSKCSFALDHALAQARELDRPLLVFEPLRAGYRWASDRMHAFVLAGMADNARAFAKAGITYLSYVEPAPGAGAGLLAALARNACVIVTDEQPGFFLPRMVAAAAKLDTRIELVDSNGILPLRATERAFTTASSFRRQLQKIVAPYLAMQPNARPLARVPAHVKGADVAGSILRKYRSETDLAKLPIDHTIAPIEGGGAVAGGKRLDAFIADRLAHYADDRNEPDRDPSSGLSPYLHFGHVGAHDVVARVWADAEWDPSKIAERVTGSREGWWGLPAPHEAFLDQIITWRELGYAWCFHRRDFDSYDALPEWARATLAKHAKDPRPHRYSLAQLDADETYDPIWNAAQRELRESGVVHNYLRMLWGKKILEWSASPKAALAAMIELNNKYAVDGRDPSSYTGILWTLGLFDRAWGPERPIFGTVRYMSSDSTKKKLRMKRYLERWSSKT